MRQKCAPQCVRRSEVWIGRMAKSLFSSLKACSTSGVDCNTAIVTQDLGWSDLSAIDSVLRAAACLLIFLY